MKKIRLVKQDVTRLSLELFHGKYLTWVRAYQWDSSRSLIFRQQI